nr:LPS-assembly protein LptD [Mesorhizobium shangrilense]
MSALRQRPRRLSRLLGATALACVLAYVAAPLHAQNLALEQNVPENSQLLLEADTLVYDQDLSTVTAVGGVRLEYGGNRVVAEKVIYNSETGRLLATGKVEIVDPEGTKFYASEIDITDDFGDGFVNALQVVTTDKTYFGAESAERRSGVLTTFNNGVYTACAPCEDKPDKAPIWRIKSQKIIWNGKTKMIRFEKPRFEMWGMPIALLPAFEIPDPSVKRKSGFLLPGLAYKSDLGYGAYIPYYFALSPTYDLTVTGTGYSEQGFLGEAEWQQRFNNGQYNLKMAGIYQADPEAFDPNTVDRGKPDDLNRFRGMIGSKGDFVLNPRWSFGWNALAQTDKDFAYTYGIAGFDNYVFRSETYLTGLNDRNFFDLRAMKFDVQEDVFNGRDEKQPLALPTFDYAYTPDEPIAGGEINIDVNARTLYRDTQDVALTAPVVRGVDGWSGRMTAEAEWRRSIVGPGGLVVSPLLQMQGDAMYSDVANISVASIDIMGRELGVAADVRSALYRYMATAGLDVRWPVLFSTTSSTHVLEPVAQVFARPDEPYSDELGIINEDAQSFVFDATTLFERDKFSGYDRIEGGTRANLGVRYSGSFAHGWTTNGIFGQSYQLAGRNSFASPDLVNAGAFSGLETETSDYVGLIGFGTPFGLSASLSARLDEETFDIRRTEVRAGYVADRFSINAKYAFIEAQPLYGFAVDRAEVSGGASAKIGENWRVFASATFDVENERMLNRGVGVSYADECFTYLMTVSQSINRVSEETSTSIGFNLSFRTLGDIGAGI